ncbi:MAG: hypothetical protein AAGC60_16785 [Acidobacteriota bacterium]
MKLSAPTQAVWIVAVILGLLGIIGFLGFVPQLAQYAFWLVTLGFLLLVFATLLRGL